MAAQPAWGQCILSCLPEADAEQESCGENANGGCCCEGPVDFESIACGQAMCGTVWADGGTRDGDWYELVTSQDLKLTWTVEAEFAVLIGVVDTDPPGSGDCSDMTGLDPFVLSEPCEVISVTTEFLPPGTYWLYVSSQEFYGLPCGSDNDYNMTVSCTDQACPDADLDGDCVVNAGDLAMLLGAWGPNPGHPADFNLDGVVNFLDLLEVLAAWELAA